MEQGTKEWLEWRRKRIGASDAPVIMGISPYKTRRELWLEKTGQSEEKGINEYISNKGHGIEEKARDILMVQTAKPWLPKTVEFPSEPRLSASLDGWNDDLMAVWECKLLGKEYYEKLTNTKLAIRNRIPEHYWPQLMQQALVTGAKTVYFTGMCIDKEGNDFIKTLKFDIGEECIQYIRKELYPKLMEFLDMIHSMKEPELSKNDVVEINDDELKNLLKEYKTISEFKKEAELKEKSIKNKIFEIAREKHNKIICNGIKITESLSDDKAVPDYEKYCEGKDLTGFSKIIKGRLTQRITFPKE